MKKSQPNSNQKSKIINDQESYFSFILSPFKRIKSKNNKNKNNKSDQQTQPQSSYNVERRPFDNGKYAKEGCEGNVDCEAEVFIREKRKNLLLSKTMSMFLRK